MRWRKGRIARQAHVGLPAGTVEEEHGREGFSGPASQLYRLHPPTAWSRIEGPLRPHAFDAVAVAGEHADERSFIPLLANDDLAVGILGRPATPTHFTRNADGDELHFIHAGSGCYETDYGTIGYTTGDYLLLPRGTTWRQAVAEPTMTLVMEARDAAFALPDRGILGRNAVVDPLIIEVPEPDPHDEAGEFEVVVKRDDQLTSVFYPFHPLDVVGWQGDLAPLRFNVAQIRPVSSERYHLPPSAHVTWETRNAVVCTFAPRPVETDPEALRLPYYHRNIDYDEAIFYHSGQFMSRVGIKTGWMTWHPQGIHHGPQPGAVERDATTPRKVRHEEVAVAVDTRYPLNITGPAEKTEWADYHQSWQPM
jgi:homogentisate 1,2-dioxygenase